MKVTLNRINDNFHFEAKGPTGVPVSIDDKTDGKTNGASPMELLLMAVGGCSGIDMVSILKKQRQEILSYQTEIEGRRVEVKEARPFDAIHVKIILEGTIDEKKAKRAAELTFDKYCSVSLTLEASVAITYEIVLNGRSI